MTRILEMVAASSIGWARLVHTTVFHDLVVPSLFDAEAGVAIVVVRRKHVGAIYWDTTTCFYADPWKQPGKYPALEVLRQSVEQCGRRFEHLAVSEAQESEGSCACVALLRAFVAAKAIAEGTDPRPIATGKVPNWHEVVGNEAKFVHRMLRIWERRV